MKISLRRVFSFVLLTSVLSLSVEPNNRDGIRIIRKKIKLPIKREYDEEVPREGRHLGYIKSVCIYFEQNIKYPGC